VNFSYFKFPLQVDSRITSDKFIYRPVIQIEIGNGGSYFLSLALLDTGSDWNFAPEDIANIINIDLSKCPSIPVSGITGAPVEARFAPVRLRIGGKKIDAIMGFGKFPTVLLGQCGFFDRIKSIQFFYPSRFDIQFKK